MVCGYKVKIDSIIINLSLPQDEIRKNILHIVHRIIYPINSYLISKNICLRKK